MCKCKHMQDTLPVRWLSRWECLWAKQRAEFGTLTSNFEQLNFIGKCRTYPYAFLLGFCKSSSSLCFYEVMENKGLFVLGPMGYFLWNPGLFFLVLCSSSKLRKMSCFQADLQPLSRGVCSQAVQLEWQQEWTPFLSGWPVTSLDLLETCILLTCAILVF